MLTELFGERGAVFDEDMISEQRKVVRKLEDSGFLKQLQLALPNYKRAPYYVWSIPGLQALTDCLPEDDKVAVYDDPGQDIWKRKTISS